MGKHQIEKTALSRFVRAAALLGVFEGDTDFQAEWNRVRNSPESFQQCESGLNPDLETVTQFALRYSAETAWGSEEGVFALLRGVTRCGLDEDSTLFVIKAMKSASRKMSREPAFNLMPYFRDQVANRPDPAEELAFFDQLNDEALYVVFSSVGAVNARKLQVLVENFNLPRDLEDRFISTLGRVVEEKKS